MVYTKNIVHLLIDGNLTTTRYGGVMYASKHPNTISEEEIASYKTYGYVIFNRTPPLEIVNLFKAGYIDVVHSIDDVIYLYSKNEVIY